LARLAGLGSVRCPVPGPGERLCAAATTAAAGNHGARPLADEIRHQTAFVPHHGAVGDTQDEVLAVSACSIALSAGTSARRTLVRMVGEPREVPRAPRNLAHHASTPAAVTAVRPAAGCVRLRAAGDAAGARA